MKMPLISVIVPAYNAEQWIEECCESVFAQTYPNRELIVVDDGSSDHTWERLRNIAAAHENVITVRTENGGVCRARNIGLDMARGELVSFLDADDMLLPDGLMFLYDKLTSDRCDIAIGQKVTVRPDGTVREQHFPRKEEIWKDLDGLEQSLRDHPATYSVWGKLYRKSLLQDVRFTEGKKVHEDSFFIFRCLMKRPCVTVSDTAVLRYRETESSASRSAFSDKFFDILYFAREKRRLVAQQYPGLLYLAENVDVKANMALLRLLSQTCDKKYRRAEKNCLKTVRTKSHAFIPATTADKKWFRMIRYRLYGIYKLYCRMKKHLQNSKAGMHRHER